MDLRSLRYFTAVYEQQSFSGAAKVCFIAQPSISNAIHQLEQELNQTLFIRHTRGVKITEHGEKLYPLATQILGQAEAIKKSFIETENKQYFSLGVTKGLGVKRMSELLKDFTATAPDMELTLVPQNEECNARIILKEELKDGEEFLTVWQEEYLLALPSNHPLSLQEHIELADLDNLPMIQRAPCSAWLALNERLAISGISLDIRAKIQTIDYAIGLIKAGLGCALVPAHPEVLEQNNIVLKTINGLTLTREIVLAYQSKTPLIKRLIKIVNLHQQR